MSAADNRRLVDDFIHDIAAVRRLSSHTVSAYRGDLQTLCRGLGDIPVQCADTLALRRIIASDKKSHPASVGRRQAAWRTFFDHLLAAGAVQSNPARALKSPKRPPRLPKSLTPEEVGAFIASVTATAGRGWIACRDAAMMELFYSSGLRLSELAALNINDADLVGGYVHVRLGKGGRGRVIPVGGLARQALTAWLKARAELMPSPAVRAEPALFVGSRLRRLGNRAIQQRLSVCGKRLGRTESVSPHMLRHSCASHFLQSSGDLRATQELLGHRDIATTQIYTRLDFQYLAAAYDRAHPRARHSKNRTVLKKSP